MALLAVAGAAAALGGCASAYLIPAGSRPLAAIPAAAAPNWERLLPGTWRLEATYLPQMPAYAGNLIRRTADMAGVAAWRQFVFAPPSAAGATLELREDGKTATLDYRVENNLIAIGPGDPRLSHEHWQPNFAGGLLYLRSLSDGEVLTLARTGGHAGP